MSVRAVSVSGLGHFVGGAWVDEGELAIESRSPADTTHVIGTFRSGLDAVDAAVSAAAVAQRAWRRAPLAERLAVVRAFGRACDRHAEPLAACISAEVGKLIAEGRAEAAALSKKAEITAALAASDLLPVQVEGGEYILRPLGVFAVIGPFNFPVHLSNGHILPALAAGNAVVLKPSESAPASAQRYLEIWQTVADDTGAPPALLSLLQGAGDVGAALAVHAGVHGVAFTGSHAVGVAIRRACAEQTGKVLALELGGKNTAVVLEDADLDATAAAIANAAFSTTGQRCTATSRVVVRQEVAAALSARLVERAAAWDHGDPFDPSAAMGPLTTARARDSFDAAQRSPNGVVTLLGGGACDGPAPGFWVRPAVHRVEDSVAAAARIETELFGPELLIEAVDDDRGAIERANATPYGLAMSVHSASAARFEAIRDELDAGLVNWNRGTAGASSALPFGGIKRSGNHRPAGAWALRYCAHPVATLRG